MEEQEINSQKEPLPDAITAEVTPPQNATAELLNVSNYPENPQLLATQPMPLTSAPRKHVVTLHPRMTEKIWKPGQTGNPNGRPKGRLSLKTYVEKGMTKERATQLCNRLFDMANDKSNKTALKAIELIAKITNCFDVKEQTNLVITSNTLNINDADFMQRLKLYTTQKILGNVASGSLQQ